MRFISTHVHGMLDYLTGVILIGSPWLLGFANGGPAQWVPVVLGIGVIAYSVVTDYELGAVKLIPMPVHLGLDIAGGVLLAASPWLFGFASVVFLPHLIVGLFEIGAGLMTHSRPRYDPATAVRT